MNVEDVSKEMPVLHGSFFSSEVKEFYFWWHHLKGGGSWSVMVEEMERDGIEPLLARYNLEKEEV